MPSSPLILGVEQLKALRYLRKAAIENPISMHDVMKAIQTKEGLAKYRDKMSEFTISLPKTFLVTFSIENGHPAGTCRHMSMSTTKQNRVPTVVALEMVAKELGFIDVPNGCSIWEEDLPGGGKAVNIIQPVNYQMPNEGKAN